MDTAHCKKIKSVKTSQYFRTDEDTADSATNGAISAAYFVNWAIYGRNHFPWELPFQSITHVLYAFANVRPETGEIYLSDSWADEQIHWADRGDSWNDEGNNLYGCFNQFRKLKQQHRHLKLLISIGGWTYSSNFAPATSTPEKRQAFANSAISILENYGLDGIDIDWEYPTNDAEADQLVDLLKRIRKGLTALKDKKQDETPYLLTIAAPCGPSHYKQLHLRKMHKYLSFINLMAYDYAGSWDTVSGHQANLKCPETEPVNQGNFSTAAAVEYYIAHSVPVKKLVMGMPLYGRSFLNTKGIGKPYSGVGQGTWEQGVYDYKALPQPGTKYVEDPKAIGAFTYNDENQELISFDSPHTVSLKVDYLISKNMGGVMWWESSADKKTKGHALIPLAASKLGTLDTTENHLNYPDSKWDNLKHYKSPSKKIRSKTHRSRRPSPHKSRFSDDNQAVEGSY
ncbi:hypothetical protein CROQUDRAFT_41152 [Cronartium quercuum f. sp. fusiforme G11]|uniref:chitinase n=1 Tax=Cronartium quercuum f. sp. fusiforme G11 TaxID=708437 RepID=A0A9P6NS74_9BASI|nr:hypothetical protein CROQUDRAFT_41152 [Cronartium quercuum f. sp. fusiforme G11]